jgi:hypothetical protein
MSATMSARLSDARIPNLGSSGVCDRAGKKPWAMLAREAGAIRNSRNIPNLE